MPPDAQHVAKLFADLKYDDVETPPGFIRLLPGQQLKAGDAVWRFAFGEFIPFSSSQIKSCDTVLSHEFVIRQTTEGSSV
jgi:hypothetical protein